MLAVAAGLALADAAIVTLALPRLLTELDASIEGVAAVIGVYTVVLALALLPAERLRARIGTRRLGAAVALALFAAACVGCAAAGSLEVLLALRAVQALGGAAALVAAFDLLGAGTEGSEGRRLWSGAAVVGFAAGPALGGLLTQVFDWRSIFVAQVPVALAGAAACVTSAVAGVGRDTSPAHRPSPPRGPLIALALLSAGLAAVLFLLVLLLVAGWNEEPLAAAAAVERPSPRRAQHPQRERQPAHARRHRLRARGRRHALPRLSPARVLWWTLVPQLLAGAGMGLALPRLAGELLPERDSDDAARLLTARHAGVALALLVLAPVGRDWTSTPPRNGPRSAAWRSCSTRRCRRRRS